MDERLSEMNHSYQNSLYRYSVDDPAVPAGTSLAQLLIAASTSQQTRDDITNIARDIHSLYPKFGHVR
jgi:hypothetical protein